MRYQGDATRGEIEILEDVVVFQNRFYTAHNDKVRFPDGSEGRYYCSYAAGPFGVCIMPVDDAGNLLLVRQFRHGPRRWMWEIPKGFGEHQLSALENAKKELREETGYETNQWEYLLTWEGDTLEGNYLFKAILSPNKRGCQELEGSEAISEVTWFSPEMLRQLLASGEMLDTETTFCIMHCLAGDGKGY